MTLSINGQLSGAAASWHHKGGHGDHAVATKPAGNPVSATPAGSATGLQGFATELQSILVGLQAAPATPSATAADPVASGSGPTAGRPLANMAGHLQQLLQGLAGPGATGTAGSATDAGKADPLQSVLDKMQASLSQAMQNYTATANRPATSLLS